MKIDSRGKYAGVKLHLEPEEVQEFVAMLTTRVPTSKDGQVGSGFSMGMTAYVHTTMPALPKKSIGRQVAKALRDHIAEKPATMEPRTEAEILASIDKETAKMAKQKAAILAKQDWTQFSGSKQ